MHVSRGGAESKGEREPQAGSARTVGGELHAEHHESMTEPPKEHPATGIILNLRWDSHHSTYSLFILFYGKRFFNIFFLTLKDEES